MDITQLFFGDLKPVLSNLQPDPGVSVLMVDDIFVVYLQAGHFLGR